MLIVAALKALLMWALHALAVWLFAAWNIYIVECNKDHPQDVRGFLIAQSLVIGLFLYLMGSEALSRCA